MDSSSGQRTLAAIVFTDVVGFTMLMGRDEAGTLQALNRDFKLMEGICTSHSGQVLKRTGDGLLLKFSSALDAVEAGLSMQEQLHSQALELNPEAILEHRIGIHLGDVVLQDSDIVGDGVNVAQRLQMEAKPGGICLSQTVYDVVKNKVKMAAHCLGSRHLKHLVEPVTIWAINPLHEGRGGHRLTVTPPVEEAAFELHVEATPTRSRTIMMMLGALAALAIFAAGMVAMLRRSIQPKGGANTIVSKPESSRRVEVELPATNPGTPQPPVPNPPATTPPTLDKALEGQPELFATLRDLRTNYQYSELADKLEAATGLDVAAQKELVTRYRALAEMMTWLETSLKSVPRDAPIEALNSKVFGDGNEMFVVGTNGEPVAITFKGMQPNGIEALMKAVIDRTPESERVKPSAWLALFQQDNLS